MNVLANIDTRHISLKFLRDTEFSQPLETAMPPEEWCEKLSPDAYHLVFFNGSFLEDFSSLPRFHPGLSVETEGGISIAVAARTKLARPLHIHYLTQAGFTATETSVVWTLDIGDGANVEVLETNEVLPQDGEAAKTFSRLQRKVVVGEKAELRWTTCLDVEENAGIFDAFELIAQPESHVQLRALQQGSGFLVSAPTILQEGERSTVSLACIAFARGSGILAQKSSWKIGASSTEGQQTFRSLVTDTAQASFGGLIHIGPGIAKVAAFQQCKNLLLSEKAQAFATPELKIDSDDVKCSHGATIARLRDEEALYLKTRGIDTVTAHKLLALGFISEVVSAWENAPYVQRIVDQDVQNGMNKVFGVSFES